MRLGIMQLSRYAIRRRSSRIIRSNLDLHFSSRCFSSIATSIQQHREAMWELECKRQQKERKNISEAISIEVHTKHGVQSVCAVANTTTPLDILKQSDERQLLICEDPVLGAQYTYNNNDGTLHNTLHDLNQPLSHSGKLNFLKYVLVLRPST